MNNDVTTPGSLIQPVRPCYSFTAATSRKPLAVVTKKL